MDNKYLSEFQIIGSTVKNVKIRNDFISLSNSKNLKRKIEISHLLGNLEAIEEGRVFSGTIILNIKVNISENKRKYNLDMSIEGCFNAPSKIGEETFRSMLVVNGITSLYSIARSFVLSTSSQTLVSGSVLLPMFNVVEYSKDLNDKQNSDKRE